MKGWGEKMNYQRNGSILVGLLLLFLSQSGCVTGLIFPPLWIPALAFGTLGAIHNDPYYLDWGVILNQDNPSHEDALNELPRGDQNFNKKYGINDQDIQDYNDHLNQIRKVAIELKEDIQTEASRWKSVSIFSISKSDLEMDPELNRLAKKYGFSDSLQFLESFHQEKLSWSQVQSFANQTQLGFKEAKLLLKIGFGVQIEELPSK